MNKKSRTLLIVVLVVVVALLAWLLVTVPELIGPVLTALLVLGVGFVVFELVRRRRKLRKQKNFDDKVAAKEGIEDRRREWVGWLAELDRQGIDRYELPFYLLVGEPQSGKSILLQNSDLYFPFGQERLSGVGGTRGCDWWFTDEAVILDIAGRMFTHEGGASDRLEWEAFLELLNEFRPLCPANGVILVIPCDSLMSDTPEQCADKANKLQAGLLSLSQKLQAQLPVYLVLTKGDTVFGFAESVHRLEAKDRHEMFGWSRPAERTDAPFDLAEVRDGFQIVVERARLLRDRMIASARLPEALPEIDRLYAFPDELAGVAASLEVYLSRIFSESTLVDRASFRGVYLTSGLQSGVPIAKVCADMIQGERASDARLLESLFSHQRAYFIKDLVRGRVFAERGLVRPTEGRVLRSRQKAIFGYGASAVLALAAGIFALVTLVKPRNPEIQARFDAAAEAGAVAVDERSDVATLLEQLASIRAAIEMPRETLYKVYQDTRPAFEGLYAAVFDQRLMPALRQQLEAVLLSRTNGSLSTSGEILALAKDASSLFRDDFDLGGSDGKALCLANISELDQTVEYYPPDVEDLARDPELFTLEDAFDLRASLDIPIPTSRFVPSDGIEELRRRTLALLDVAITPGDERQVGGHLGYVLAWRGVEQASDALKSPQVGQDRNVLEHCRTLGSGLTTLEELVGQLEKGDQGYELVNATANPAGTALLNEKAALATSWLDIATSNATNPPSGWPALDSLEVFETKIFKDFPAGGRMPGLGSLFRGALGDMLREKWNGSIARGLSSRPVPSAEIKALQNDDNLRAVCVAEPGPAWTLGGVAGSLETGRGRFLETLDTSEPAHVVYVAKCAELARQLVERYPDWESASRALAEERGEAASLRPGELDPPLVSTLAAICDELRRVDPRDFETACRHLEGLAIEHLRGVDNAWNNRTDWGSRVEWDTAEVLASVVPIPAGGDAELSDLARRLVWRYLGEHEARLLRTWEADEDAGQEATLDILGALNEHLAGLARVFEASKGDLSEDADHRAWLANVDTLASERLTYHVDELRKHWTPNTSGWAGLDLRSVASAVLDAFDNRELEKRIDGLRTVDAPKSNAPALASGKPIDKAEGLDRTRAQVEALRGLEAPRQPGDVQREGQNLRRRAEEMQNTPGMATDGARMAEKTRAERLAPQVESTDAASFYVGSLQSAFRKRLISEVRSLYAERFADAILSGNASLVDDLYSRTSDEINRIRDVDMVSNLGRILDEGGLLEDLREEFGMTPGEGDLRFGEGESIPQGDADLWEFETFLGELQQFLLGGEARKVEDVEFRIALSLPNRVDGSLWDTNQDGYREFLHYGTDALNPSSRGFLVIGSSKVLDSVGWQFHPSQEERFVLRWSNRADGESDAGDLEYSLVGSMAPLLLAWSGTKDDDGTYEVQLDPQSSSSALRAKLRLKLGDRDLPERRPLERPRGR